MLVIDGHLRGNGDQQITSLSTVQTRVVRVVDGAAPRLLLHVGFDHGHVVVVAERAEPVALRVGLQDDDGVRVRTAGQGFDELADGHRSLHGVPLRRRVNR